MTNIRFTSGDRHVISAGGDDCRLVTFSAQDEQDYLLLVERLLLFLRQFPFMDSASHHNKVA